MKTLHQAMMGVTLVVTLVVSLGVIQPAVSAALGQHGQAQHGHGGMSAHQIGDAESLLAMLSEHLGLSEDQQHAIAEPVSDAFTAMQQMHAAHAAIVAELTEEQAQQFNTMVHELMSTGSLTMHGDH